VCGKLEEALSAVVRQPVWLTVAGRTDSGVHADGQVAHTDLPTGTDVPELFRRLAKLLPTDLRVTSLTQVVPQFDARFSALRRHYEYRVGTAVWGVPPHERRRRLHHPPRRGVALDLARMNSASAELLGLHDFAAYCRSRPCRTTRRELQGFEWRRISDELVVARVSADAFCWQMVRSLVGALLAVGDGRRPPQWPAELLELRSRSSEVPVAPAYGLSLVGVDYPAENRLAERAEQARARRSRCPIGRRPD
jgi:tRNA pseudouridine38-40 synthase